MKACDNCGESPIAGILEILAAPIERNWTHADNTHFTLGIRVELCRDCYVSLRGMDVKTFFANLSAREVAQNE
jgi:hypothetical protein